MKFLWILMLLVSTAIAADRVNSITINTPKGWGKEIIQLPPGFAKDMKYKGAEDIRFAPGMFEPTAKDFFTYVFILSGTLEGGLSLENVKSEILKYYKGLGKAVGGKRFKVDPETFKLVLKKTEDGFTGTLKWIEPFKTGKEQTLNLELKSWDTKDKQFLFAMVSPAGKDSDVWKNLKKIGDKLTIK